MVNNAVFNELMAIAGWSDGFDEQVSITGHDPVLPTRFQIGEMVAGIHAARGVAVSKLWELETGRKQQVAIDVRAATATLQSYVYLKIDGEEQRQQQAPAQQRQAYGIGFQKTRDGRWFYIHGYGRQRIPALLQCEDNLESMPDVISRWDSQELEDAFAEAGLCGAIVRSADEWLSHPQGIVLQELPVVEIVKIGDSTPEPLPTGEQPLSGIRVLDLTIVLAGPTCGRTLAEHGADVLKIISPERPAGGAFDMDTGHGKRAAFLDLLKDSDKEKLWSLIREADVFSQSYRHGALAGKGFHPEALAEVRPGIIYTSVNCYGHEGPWSGRRGWEQLGQVVSGVADEEGIGAPRLLPAAVNDFNTGYLAAFGTLVALERRAREGGSYRVRVSLTQSSMLLHRQGRIPQDEWWGRERMLPPEEISSLTAETDTPYGRMTHLAPVLQLSETPTRWRLPSVPMGTHQPVWLER
ncbi:MAG: CoA transferase [Dehalococcoidales bacterium]|nr:MAG: CoA transferase [Dehalococcoidales bacterium]